MRFGLWCLLKVLICLIAFASYSIKSTKASTPVPSNKTKEQTSSSTPSDETPDGPPECKSSVTLVNGKPQCSGKLIFDAPSKDKWNKAFHCDVQITEDNEEFVVFNNYVDNLYVEEKLFIKPTLLDDQYGENFTATGNLDLKKRCTSKIRSLCTRKATETEYLPSVLSARVSTKGTFSFRYGEIKVKAKVPRGDWIVPEIWLLPKQTNPDKDSSGKIIIARSLGNELLFHGWAEVGNSKLYSGLHVGKQEFPYTTYKAYDIFGRNFKEYTLVWKPDSIRFLVNDVEHGRWSVTSDSPFLNGTNTDPIAPFNEEYYIVLGVTVGGAIFPDGSESVGRKKPWNNTDENNMRRFYNDRHNWYPTWRPNASELVVEYVKVWAV